MISVNFSKQPLSNCTYWLSTKSIHQLLANVKAICFICHEWWGVPWEGTLVRKAEKVQVTLRNKEFSLTILTTYLRNKIKLQQYQIWGTTNLQKQKLVGTQIWRIFRHRQMGQIEYMYSQKNLVWVEVCLHTKLWIKGFYESFPFLSSWPSQWKLFSM